MNCRNITQRSGISKSGMAAGPRASRMACSGATKSQGRKAQPVVIKEARMRAGGTLKAQAARASGPARASQPTSPQKIPAVVKNGTKKVNLEPPDKNPSTAETRMTVAAAPPIPDQL